MGAVLIALIAIFAGRPAPVSEGAGQASGIDEMKALWETGKYAELLDASKENLSKNPLEEASLVYRGLASFHLGIAQSSLSAKLPFLDDAVFSLRKALLIVRADLMPKLKYVLGKAYYHKGGDYADLAVRYLLEAREAGYEAKDISEYLALSHEALGEHQEAIADYESMPGVLDSPAMLLRIAKSYYTLGRIDKAEEYIALCLAQQPEREIEEQAGMLLAEALQKKGDLNGAEKAYLGIIEKREGNAEAHFSLGLLYETAGDLVRARYEWRRTLKIDANHAGARRKLKL